MKDIIGYLAKMQKSMIDKLFFVDKIDLNNYELVVDFGCANGDFIKSLSTIFPNLNYLGYDISQQMIKRAQENICQKNVEFVNEKLKLVDYIKNKKYVIIFSSVLHELNNKDFNFVLDLMKNSSAVIIRDMYFDTQLNQSIDCSKILNKQDNKQYINDFEKIYGKIDNLKNLYHYFLKWTYIDNWSTELLENYLGIDYNRIIDELSLNDFNIFYDEKFTLPYKKDEIKRCFDFDLVLPTHRKLIFTKEKKYVK